MVAALRPEIGRKRDVAPVRGAIRRPKLGRRIFTDDHAGTERGRIGLGRIVHIRSSKGGKETVSFRLNVG